MNGWEILKWGSVAVGSSVALSLAVREFYRAALTVYDDLYSRWIDHRQTRLSLAHVATQNKLHDIRAIPADERGRYPLLYGINGILRDPNNLRAFTLRAVRETWPFLENIDARIRAVVGAGGWPAAATAERMLPEQPAPVVTWSEVRLLSELARQGGASLERLIIGKAQDGQVIKRSLHELMHTLAVGVTGKGKTTWLVALLAQLALAREPVEVLAVDTRGAGFNILSKWGKLRYPVARHDSEAVAQLHEVCKEIRRRMALYERYPIVDKLPIYNQVADEPLTPWVCVIDEGTQLLGEKDIADPLRKCVQTGRQYGIYVLASGQTAKYTTVSTEIRDNFVTRMAFRTSPASTRVVLGENPPHPIENTPGRAWAQLDGDNECIEVQGPYIDRADFLHLLSNGGAKYAMPITETPSERTRLVDDPDNIRQVLELHAQGESDTAIARIVFGHGTTFYIDRVRTILQQHNDTDTHESGQERDNESGSRNFRYVVEGEN